MANAGNLDNLLNEINKKFGEGTIMTVNDAKGLSYVRIPTGIFELDIGMGIGENDLAGIPRGRVVLLKGDESTGKTSISKRHIAEAQKMCRNCNTYIQADIVTSKIDGTIVIEYIDKETGEIIEDKNTLCECGNPEPMRCAYLDAEGGYDPIWAKSLGVDNNRVILIQPEFAEQGIDVAEALIRTGDIDVLIVDSIAALVPAVEIEDSAGDQQMGVHPKLVNKFMRLITSGINSLGMSNTQKPTVVLINQKRQKLGVMFGSNEALPGGKGQGFTASIIVDLRHVGKIDTRGEDWSYKKNTEVVGTRIAWRVDKNKTAPPHKTGNFVVFSGDTDVGYLKGDIDNPSQIIGLAVKLGIITRGGSWFTYKDVKVQGMPKMVVELMNNEELYNDLEEQVIMEVKNKLLEEI